MMNPSVHFVYTRPCNFLSTAPSSKPAVVQLALHMIDELGRNGKEEAWRNNKDIFLFSNLQ